MSRQKIEPQTRPLWIAVQCWPTAFSGRVIGWSKTSGGKTFMHVAVEQQTPYEGKCVYGPVEKFALDRYTFQFEQSARWAWGAAQEMLFEAKEELEEQDRQLTS